jgi:hypothetical protein
LKVKLIYCDVLAGEVKLYKHPKSQTMYITVPAKIVQDSAFVLKAGQKVPIRYDPETNTIIIGKENKRDKK